MSAPKKRIKLEDMENISGYAFREAIRDETGNPKLDIRKDSDNKPIMQVPRNEKGEAIPNCQPEPVYIAQTKVVKKALPMLLKRLYLNMPKDKLTRQDTIYGTRLFQNIADSQDGYLELSEDVHTWVGEKLKDESIGLEVFGVDLSIIESAVDNFERKHEAVKEKE